MTSEPSPHRRANHFGNNHVRMLPAQVVQQHFRYQIHAGPTLFHKITDDGNAQLIHQTPTTVLPDLKDWLLAVYFFRSKNQTWLARKGESHATGDAFVCSRQNLRHSISRSILQLNPL